MKRLRLILGDQLNADHSWFAAVDPDVTYVMMEVRSETDYVVHHAQKVISIFAAMRRFAEMLRQRGHAVRYVHIGDADNTHTFDGNLANIAREVGAQQTNSAPIPALPWPIAISTRCRQKNVAR